MPAAPDIGILAPRVVRESALPRRWRRRGGFTELAGLDDVGLLARAFRIEPNGLAAAPLHYLGMTGEDPAGYCLFAYPVYLHARREQLILMSGPELELSDAESDSLVELLRGHFPEWRVERTPDAMWFVIIDRDPQLETTPLQDVLGENINDHLPRGGDAMEWHKMLNELQMLLFDAEVNREREAAGRLPVNSLWLWGGGRLPAMPAPPWRRVVTDNPVAHGMARCAEIESRWQDRPLARRAPDGDEIIAPDTLWVLSGTSDREEAAPTVSAAQWQALRSALRQGEIEQLILIEPGYGELRIDTRTAASWWPW